ncbi:DUF6923 family protein [Flavivirga jejuensis]|uniref:T9SS type A sorting domain-containing protein n=1 Tax=Flavivirga jejuensis TaxID=870487 RepID=A0ABT8WPP4_9FLAO|nr:T9SS type A sorting domain-containing protein [Flavivirga jejuensis]MDO5975119.1 T9SS type A sorting domain-containing protein [Flavivirga jejuensis]
MNKNLLFVFVFAFITHSNAQDEPFNCDYNAYLFQYNDVYAIDLASGSSYNVATDITEGTINAAAYNPADGFIWGSLSYPSKSIVRIGKDFSTLIFYVDELSTSGRYIGDINTQGVYYLKGGGTTYYTIDVNPNSENYGNHIATNDFSQSLSIHDWAFNAVDDKLYTVEKNTNKLYRIDPDTNIIEDLGEVPILSGLNYTYGAVYFDASGRFYVSANQTGTVYVIQNVQDIDGTNAIDSNLFAFGPSSSQNDGARCPTAPVPQEDCINGIDDDGDGLVDCEDPSCSGYASCPVIVAPISSGNEGGLESNNRLSELINKRNFNRAKNNYKFDKASAKRLVKSAKYGKKAGKTGLQLSDFVPIETISEDYIIESSPTDLLNITNATDIYSVDYMKEDKAIATILVLKTDSGVYEHTKYICDRLLGAELLSVSTIEIRDHSFIKALIRNVDGSLEFVLSLSAKPSNGDNNFEVESHWNLDKYESNVPFYNFQIWSNSLDDLLHLSEEVVRLLDIQKPVTSYNSSAPPTVFVKKGKYHHGKLELQIVNSNKSESINFNAGLRATETNVLENITSTLNLDGNYITNIEVDTGSLFDIGFRIGDGIQTPDDLFMSDGPWGYDDASSGTELITYDIVPNKEAFDAADFPIERNIELIANTNDYIAAYRALTPKYNPVDVSNYNSLQFKAKGTGTMTVRLIKESISNWDAQYKTDVVLTDKLQDYSMPFSEFTSTNGNNFTTHDITSMIFTMTSETGEEETKEMTLEQLRFSTSKAVLVESLNDKIVISPNPMISNATLHFTSEDSESVELLVYNQLGSLVKRTTHETVEGKNEIKLGRIGLNLGMYFCSIKSNTKTYDPIKLLIE